MPGRDIDYIVKDKMIGGLLLLHLRAKIRQLRSDDLYVNQRWVWCTKRTLVKTVQTAKAMKMRSILIRHGRRWKRSKSDMKRNGAQ